MRTRRASYSPDTSPIDREMFPKRQKLNHAQVESRSQSDKPGEDFEQTFEESNHNEAVLSENAKDVSVQEKPISTQLESVPEEDADEFIERLLRQAEENLSSKTNEKQLTFPNVKLNPGSLPKPYFEITKKGNKLLTEHLEDSVIVTANNTTIKRLDPPISKSQKDKIRGATAGDKWFDMPSTELTPSIKRDLTLLQMRDVLDPKRHYRASSKTLPKYFQMGRIVEAPHEFFSARIKKKDRKETIVQELLADQKSREYFKKKYSEIQEKATSGGKKWYRKMQERKNKR